ncbi:MAG: MmcQ/YjbR family DNA-binding protein [Bacteroidota bacterium]|nr:MmcQ/YjbR family DNA-binding protein [Bacteroidota bacterium]
MDLETIRRYCLRKKGKITEEFPFGEGALVFKVFGKMFLLAMLDDVPLTINLKCDPATALDLRERYRAVTPGYHMNKKHWNTVTIDGSVPDKEMFTMIDHSFELVVSRLPKNQRRKIKV